MTFVHIPCPAALFAEQRVRLAGMLRDKLGGGAAGAVAVLKGNKEVPRSADTTFGFRQDSYFQFLFGHEAPDCFGALDVASGKGYLFIPRLPQEYAVWMGELPTPEGIKAATEVDAVYYVDEMAAVLKDTVQAKAVHILAGLNTDSGEAMPDVSFEGIDAFALVKDLLFDTINDARLYKSAKEEALLAELNTVSSRAHVAMMQACKPGLRQTHLLGAFTGYAMCYGGCKALAYGAICATGKDNAVLHYVDNDKVIEDGTLALMDLGAERHCYAADITTSFPVNGKFTAPQAALYNVVLRCHDEIIKCLKPGVSWLDMQLLAHRIIGAGLRDMGILVGTDEELAENEVTAYFFPHGLGHLIGLDVHDVGGYAPSAPKRSASKLASKVRTARVLEERFFMTVEPGAYFNAVLLEQALALPAVAKHINAEKVRAEFWDMGGVRIESNLIITADGCRNLTNVPRTVADIEAVMAGGKWE